MANVKTVPGVRHWQAGVRQHSDNINCLYAVTMEIMQTLLVVAL